MQSYASRTNTETGRLFQPVRFYLLNYRRMVLEERFRGYLGINLLLWIFLVVANIIDIQVTYTVFAGGGIELNPFMAFLCTTFGNISLAFYKGICLGILFILLPFVRNAYQKLLILSCIVYAVLMVSHWIRF